MKTKLTTAIVALLSIVLFTQCDEDEIINANELPQEARLFLETNFADKSYVIEKDTEGSKVIYEVEIAGGTEVEFNAEGKCIYVGGRVAQVPSELISSEIQSYILTNYPGETIVEWEWEDNYQEVELSNNIELVFDLDNNFLFSRHDDDDDNETAIEASELPEAVKAFVSTHFPQATISAATVESKLTFTEYEVTLSNAFQLEFNGNGNCLAIDGNNQPVPDSALNSQIVAYVKGNYPQSFIVEWDLDSRTQEVELHNGVELTFDLDGNFRYAEVDD